MDNKEVEKTLNIQDIFKKDIKQYVSQMAKNFKDIKNENEEEKITLYHGTCSVFLNSILKEGIKPRKQTGEHNWKENEKAHSLEDVVYLTNKWQYIYAYNATERLLKEKYGEEWSENRDAQWWLNFNPLPIYIKCTIPKSRLIIDEDIVYTNFFKNKVKKAIKQNKDLKLNMTWEDSLKNLGTVGFIGEIPPEYIESIVVLGSAKMYLNLMNKDGQYQKDWSDWAKGKGKGKLKNKELKDMEKQYYPLVGNIGKPTIPNGYIISQIVPKDGNLAYTLNRIEDIYKQPVALERY